MSPHAPLTEPLPPRPTVARSHILLFAGLGIAATAMAVQGFRLLQVSNVHMKDELVQAKAVGATADHEGCVDHVMNWYAHCSAMKSLCDGSVGRVMEACLAARDRTAECAALGEQTRHTQFGFKECQARGVDRWNKKACAGSYRAIDMHCSQPSRG